VVILADSRREVKSKGRAKGPSPRGFHLKKIRCPLSLPAELTWPGREPIVKMLRERSLDMFGSIGLPELIVIFIIALLVFGPKKLPEVGKTVGKAIRDFKKSTEDIKEKFEDEIRAEEFRSLKDDLNKDIKEDEEGKKISG
jgi:sec-independent protein translocase protein TatA